MYQEFGRLLKSYRLAKKLSQSELVDRLNNEGYIVSNKSVISKWENGSRPNSQDIVTVLEEILEVQGHLLLKAAGYLIYGNDTVNVPVNDYELPDKANSISTIRERVVAKNLVEHFNDMAKIAEAMVNTSGLDTVRRQKSSGQIEYCIVTEEGEEDISLADISDRLQDSFDTMYETVDHFDADCFVHHFNAENSNLHIPKSFESQPFKIAHLLKTLSRRKRFKGTCPVCKSLY